MAQCPSGCALGSQLVFHTRAGTTVVGSRRAFSPSLPSCLLPPLPPILLPFLPSSHPSFHSLFFLSPCTSPSHRSRILCGESLSLYHPCLRAHGPSVQRGPSAPALAFRIFLKEALDSDCSFLPADSSVPTFLSSARPETCRYPSGGRSGGFSDCKDSGPGW